MTTKSTATNFDKSSKAELPLRFRALCRARRVFWFPQAFVWPTFLVVQSIICCVQILGFGNFMKRKGKSIFRYCELLLRFVECRTVARRPQVKTMLSIVELSMERHRSAVPCISLMSQICSKQEMHEHGSRRMAPPHSPLFKNLFSVRHREDALVTALYISFLAG